MALTITPNDPHLLNRINSLLPTLGYCIFIDMASSTAAKDARLSTWIIHIYNVFANILSFIPSLFRPIKCLGDGLMFFIPSAQLRGETPLTLFDSLVNIAVSDEEFIKPVRIGAAFCREAYEISFFPNYPDIYGKDIDLTARLASIAEPREIVMNAEFVSKVQEEYSQIFNKQQFPDVPNIIGPISQEVRGFREPVNIYKTRRPG